MITAQGRLAAGLSVSATIGDGWPSKAAPIDVMGLYKFTGLRPGPLKVQAVGRLHHGAGEAFPDPVLFQEIDEHRHGRAVKGIDPSKESLWAVSVDVPARVITSGKALQLQMKPAPTIRGRVIGSDSNWPQPHEVFVYRQGWREEVFRGIPSTEGTFPVDPATGEFEGQLPPGSYVAEATAGRPSDATNTKDSPQVKRSNAVLFEVAAEDVELRLDFGAALGLKGSVKLPDGTPIDAIDVLLGKQESMFRSTVATVTTDNSGEFQFIGLQAGTYIVRVRSSRYVAGAVTAVTIAETNAAKPAHLVVQEAGAIRIEVVDANGDPIPDAEPYVLRPNGMPAFPPVIKDDPKWTGARGPLVPGTYVAICLERLDKGAIRFHRERTEVEAGKVTTVSVQMAAEAISTIQGQVLSGGAAPADSKASPVAGVSVWLSDDLGFAGYGKTDAEGRFWLDSASSGPMTLSAGTSMFSPAVERPITVATGPTGEAATAVAITLPTGSIECTFAKDSGATLFIQPALDRVGAPKSGAPHRHADSSFQGLYTIPYLADGQYELYVLGSDSRRSLDWEPQTIEIQGGQSVTGIELRRRR